MLETVAVVDARRLGGRVDSRDLPDLFGRQPGDACRPFRCVFLYMIFEFFETIGPLRDEFRIVETLVDHDIQHRQCQSSVRAGSDRDPNVGQGHIRLHGGLDGNDLGAAVLGVQNRFQTASGASRIDRLFTPNHDEVAAREIWSRRGAQGVAKGEALLHGADTAMSVVGAAVRHQEPVQVVAVGSAGRGQDPQRFRSVFVFLFLEFLGDDVERLIPANSLKFTLSLLPDAFQRVLQTLRRIDPLWSGMGLGAVSPLVFEELPSCPRFLQTFPSRTMAWIPHPILGPHIAQKVGIAVSPDGAITAFVDCASRGIWPSCNDRVAPSAPVTFRNVLRSIIDNFLLSRPKGPRYSMVFLFP